MAKKIKVAVEVKGADKAKQDLKGIGSAAGDAAAQTGLFGGVLSKLSGIFRTVTGVIKTTTLGLKGFKLALAATGIGLIVIALGSLVAMLTSTQGGVDKVSQVFSGLKAGLDVIIDRLSDFGGGLALILKGNFREGLDKLKASFKGIGEEISKEVEAAADITEQLQKLEDRRISSISVIAKQKSEIAKLRSAAEDETLSTKERIKALEDASVIQNKITNEEVEQAEIRARLIQERINLGKSLRGDIEELENLKAIVSQKETERFNLEKALISRRRALKKEASTEEKRLIDEGTKKKEEAAAKQKEIDEKSAAGDKKAKEVEAQLEKQLNILKNELRLDDIGKELLANEMKKQARIKVAEESISDLKELKKILEEIEKDSATKIDAIKEDFAEKERVRQQKLTDELKQRNKEIVAAAIETGLKQLDMLMGFQDLKQQQSQNEFDFNTQLRDEDFANETSSLESRLLNINENLDAKNSAESIALEKRILNEKLSEFQQNKERKLLEIKQNKEKKLAEINERKLKEGLEISQIKRENEAIEARNKVKKEEFESNKKLAIAETIISGAMAAISAFRSMASIPVVGPALGIVAAAAVAIFTAAQVSTINKSKFTGGVSSIPVPPKTDFAAQSARVETEAELATAGVEALKEPTRDPSGTAGAGGFGAGGAGTGVDVPGVLCPDCPSFETEGDEVFGAGGAGARQRTITAVVSEFDITKTQERLRKFEERAELD